MTRSWRRASGRFVLVTALSFAVNVGLTAGLHEVAGATEPVAFGVALAVVMCGNFLALRYYIFEGREGSVRRQAVLFVASSVAFRGAEYLAFLALHLMGGVHYLIAAPAVLVASFAAKFFWYGGVVFEGRRAGR